MSTILIVEDDNSLGYILKEYLEMHKFIITLAKDGLEGLEIFNRHHFDLCILDVMLPKKDGFEILQDLRKTDRTKTLPVILLTNLGQKPDVERGISLGADDYIIKAHYTTSIKIHSRITGGNIFYL